MPLLALAAVTAMPSTAPLSASVTLSTCPLGTAKSTSDDTSVPTAPTGALAFSSIAVSAGLLVTSSTGAVFVEGLIGAATSAHSAGPEPLLPVHDIVTEAAPASVLLLTTPPAPPSSNNSVWPAPAVTAE